MQLEESWRAWVFLGYNRSRVDPVPVMVCSCKDSPLVVGDHENFNIVTTKYLSM